MGDRAPEGGAGQPRGEPVPATQPATQPAAEALLRWSRRHAEAARAARAEAATPRRAAGPAPGAGVLRPVLGGVAGLLRVACWLVALLIVAYVVFRVADANPTNMWAAAVESWAPRLDLGLADLVSVGGPGISLAVNYGLAAVAWAVLGAVAGWLIRLVAKI